MSKLSIISCFQNRFFRYNIRIFIIQNDNIQIADGFI